MKAATSPTVRWHARRGADALGPAGLLALAVFIAAAVLALLALGPLRTQRDTWAQEQARWRERTRSLPMAADAPAGPQQALLRFYGSFPAGDSTVHWLSLVERAAESQQLVLAAGEYRLERLPNQRLVRYQMTLPVRGSYRQVRGFLAEVLRTVPAAALDDVQFKRDGGGDALEAKVRLSLYLDAR